MALLYCHSVTCSFCGRAHPYFALTRHVLDSSESMLLCSACAEELRIYPQHPPANVSASDLLAGLLDSAVEQQGTSECPECGQTMDELRRTGRAGCPNCYIHFQSLITTHLKRAGWPARHNGRYPARLTQYRDFFQQRETLHQELDSAVAAEDYEAAARVRDQLDQRSEGPQMPHGTGTGRRSDLTEGSEE